MDWLLGLTYPWAQFLFLTEDQAQMLAEGGPLAVVAALLTFLVTKTVDFVLSKRQRMVDQNLLEGTTIRTELREEVVQLRQDVRDLSDEVDIWREKYLEIRDELGVERVNLHASKEVSRMLRQKLVEVIDAVEHHDVDLGVAIKPLIDSIQNASDS